MSDDWKPTYTTDLQRQTDEVAAHEGALASAATVLDSAQVVLDSAGEVLTNADTVLTSASNVVAPLVGEPDLRGFKKPVTPAKTAVGETSQSLRFQTICENAKALFLLKNAQYGNAIEFTGVLGAVVAMTGDVARLRQMTLRSEDFGVGVADNVRDKLQDVLVQAVIGILMLDDGNWDGK